MSDKALDNKKKAKTIKLTNRTHNILELHSIMVGKSYQQYLESHLEERAKKLIEEGVVSL